MKRIMLIAMLAVAACAPQSEVETKQVVEEQQAHYIKTQPVPFFDYSLDRDTLIQIYKAKNESRQTHAVVTSQGTGEIIWDCPAIGYPLPADVQLTNPVAVYGGSGAVIEQPEPNGLFSSKNTDATYVLCIGPEGDVAPVYTEQKVTTFPFPVTIVDGVITRSGDATITVDLDQ